MSAPARSCQPAFPVPDSRFANQRVGVTVREYFMAHAPAEPQPWFEPVMPPKPELPSKQQLTDDQRQQLDSELPDYEPGRCDPAVLDFIARRDVAYECLEAWTLEQKKQRYLQWPAAWADAVLAQLDQPGGGS